MTFKSHSLAQTPSAERLRGARDIFRSFCRTIMAMFDCVCWISWTLLLSRNIWHFHSEQTKQICGKSRHTKRGSALCVGSKGNSAWNQYFFARNCILGKIRRANMFNESFWRFDIANPKNLFDSQSYNRHRLLIVFEICTILNCWKSYQLTSWENPGHSFGKKFARFARLQWFTWTSTLHSLHLDDLPMFHEPMASHFVTFETCLFAEVSILVAVAAGIGVSFLQRLVWVVELKDRCGNIKTHH